ncbi:MAG: hypothetical protein IJL14_02880 [Selenomonadaceae bacterium]|nr:hypothetical protein [Selenomonadaceae bacterium]
MEIIINTVWKIFYAARVHDLKWKNFSGCCKMAEKFLEQVKCKILI